MYKLEDKGGNLRINVELPDGSIALFVFKRAKANDIFERQAMLEKAGKGIDPLISHAKWVMDKLVEVEGYKEDGQDVTLAQLKALDCYEAILSILISAYGYGGGPKKVVPEEKKDTSSGSSSGPAQD